MFGRYINGKAVKNLWCTECEQEMENDYEVKMQGAPLMAFFKIQKGKEIKK